MGKFRTKNQHRASYTFSSKKWRQDRDFIIYDNATWVNEQTLADVLALSYACIVYNRKTSIPKWHELWVTANENKSSRWPASHAKLYERGKIVGSTMCVTVGYRPGTKLEAKRLLAELISSFAHELEHARLTSRRVPRGKNGPHGNTHERWAASTQSRALEVLFAADGLRGTKRSLVNKLFEQAQAGARQNGERSEAVR